ncbi:MAG: hypothetical protein AAB472_01300 [Patescibacteria group bacterium]
MKRFIALFATIALSVSPALVTAAKSAPQNARAQYEAAEAAVLAACKEARITKCDFAARYKLVKYVEMASRKLLFTPAGSYKNTTEQNLKLARNIRKNKTRFTNGEFNFTLAQSWEVVA